MERGGGPDWAAARSQLPPKWVDVVDKVRRPVAGEGQAHRSTDGRIGWQITRPCATPQINGGQVDDIVRTIESQMKELSALHRKRLLVSFDDTAEVSKEK